MKKNKFIAPVAAVVLGAATLTGCATPTNEMPKGNNNNPSGIEFPEVNSFTTQSEVTRQIKEARAKLQEQCDKIKSYYSTKQTEWQGLPEKVAFARDIQLTEGAMRGACDYGDMSSTIYSLESGSKTVIGELQGCQSPF